jgi:ComF family protein
MVNRRGEFLVDILFPKFCVACRREGEWLCFQCLQLELDMPQTRGFSVVPGAGLDSLIFLSEYGNNPISELARLLKYQFAIDTLSDLENIIRKKISSFDLAEYVLVPVPLHPRRYRERGFNQAEAIANVCSRVCGAPVAHMLHRNIYTKQQAKLSGLERMQNTKGAFRFEDIGKAPEKVILVDDIFTTGSTMGECALVLRGAGVREVRGLVLAKG